MDFFTGFTREKILQNDFCCHFIVENNYFPRLINDLYTADNYELPSANISRVNITASDPPETGGLNADDLKDPDFMFSVRDTYKYRAQVSSNTILIINVLYIN